MESKVEVYACPMTQEEVIVLPKFKDFIKSKNCEYDSNKFDDVYLLRFLRARKMDLNKSLEMFSNFLKWRKESNVDQIEEVEFPELDKVKLYYPHGLHKTDKQGRPIYIEVLGDLKVDDLFKAITSERLMLYQVKCYEGMLSDVFPICTTAAKKYVSQTFTIFDLKKLSSKLLSKKVYGFLKLTSSISQAYYPEILGQLYIVNAGLLFKAAWTVCKSFMDEKTRKKITTLGSDYQKKLLEHVDPENLPAFLGGTCNCTPYGCINSNAGPWNKEGVASVNPELIIKKEDVEKLELLEEEVNGEAFFNGNDNGEDDEDEEDKERLAELSKQLNENMKLSKGQMDNAKYKMENNQEDDGETPINTQEGGDYDA